jgi:hypothetical protein
MDASSGDEERKPTARKRVKLDHQHASAAGGEKTIDPADDEAAPSSIEFNKLPGEIKKLFFGFLDVKTLCIAREVSREWKENCEQAIEHKKKEGAGIFTTNEELKQAVNDYYNCKYEEYDAELAEKVCREYGWAIGRWNVSAVTDFSEVFHWKHNWVECLGSH